MDWLEKKREKIQKIIKNSSLEKCLLGYLVVMLLGVLALSIFTRALAKSWLLAYMVTHGNMDHIWESSGQYFLVVSKDRMEELVMLLYRILYNASGGFFVIGSFVTAKLFVRNRIRPALDAIDRSARAMESGDCHIEVNCGNDDEMGQMCRQFEKMRKRLVEEKKQIWKMQEEQRQVNAAFAHDMRTPLTVIEGYTEFLLRCVPKKQVDEKILLEKLELMRFQEERLYEFSKTMSRIQRMEELQVNGQRRTLKYLWHRVEDIVSGIGNRTEKEIRLLWLENSDGGNPEFFVDADLICEVFENMLSNAMVYAKETISVDLRIEDQCIRLTVKDDGKGFSDSALKNAYKPYYTEKNNSKKHFGIGLFICRLLTEKHAGSLMLVNSLEGGAIAIADFGIQLFL